MSILDFLVKYGYILQITIGLIITYGVYLLTNNLEEELENMYGEKKPYALTCCLTDGTLASFTIEACTENGAEFMVLNSNKNVQSVLAINEDKIEVKK